jgi:excisionase family DNA binding protein
MSENDLTTQQVAEQLQVTPAAVTSWCRAGTLPAYRAGKGWRIRKEDLAVFVRRGVPFVPEAQRTAV